MVGFAKIDTDSLHRLAASRRLRRGARVGWGGNSQVTSFVSAGTPSASQYVCVEPSCPVCAWGYFRSLHSSVGLPAGVAVEGSWLL
jgi:hypothetical protein